MSEKIWRANGEYRKKKRVFNFSTEMLAPSEALAREKILSELGSRHRVKRREITVKEIKELKPEEVTNLDLRKLLGLESDI